MYALTITFADQKNNAFVELGGAAWTTCKEQLEQWNSIPAAPGSGMTTCFLLDKRGKNGFDIEDTKCITAEQVEFLLSEPITTLIERGRKNCPDCAA
jgi:hypothetical protein